MEENFFTIFLRRNILHNSNHMITLGNTIQTIFLINPFVDI